MRNTLIALLALMVAGCGSGTSPTSPSDTAALPTTSVVAADTTVTVTQPRVSSPSLPTPTVVVDSAEAPPAVRSITVGGMGAEYAEPNRCVIDIGVTSRRPTVGESGRAVAAAADAITATLTAAGVDASDIQTSEFAVGPYYDDYPIIAGFETHIGYRVALPDVGGVGGILAEAMDAGGDDVRAWGIRFETDTDGLMEAARAEAWADVTARAESLASLAGEPLGEVLDAHEKVLISSSQGMMQGGEGDSASFDIPVSPGVAGVVVLLTVTFAIGE